MVKLLVGILLIIVLVGLQYRLWFEQNGVRDTVQLKNAISAQQQKNQQMQIRNQALMAEVRNLKTGKQAIEEHARSELGMIKDGEQFYQIATPNSDQKPQS